MQDDLCEIPEKKKKVDIGGTLRRNCHPKKILLSTIPSITWFSTYQWKEWLVRDAVSGFTVAVMNIPQGMAYALLANVPPVVGIYMAFFPVIVYAFLGTSRHVSMGSFAVICLMTGNAISKHIDPTNKDPDMNKIMEIGTAITFLAGAFQVILYIFRLGIVCTLLSDTLISGFTAGAAVHVFTSQIKDILGISLPHFSGPFKVINTYKSIFEQIQQANTAALIISGITIVVLLINNEILKPRVAKKTKIPIPIELIVVLCGTLASYYGHIAKDYELKTVGEIAKGLPSPQVPNFSIMPSIAIDSATIAIIAYIVSVSMALIFANKLKYEVNTNQELLAQGVGNLVGSFFSCLPISASLSRSVIQQSVGGCTQLASLISCSILLVILLWIGPFFEPLPRCVLAGLIVVALKGILLQALDIFEIWKVSPLDGIIWLVTYLTVIIVGIEYGLLAGLGVSVLILILRGAQASISTLERLPSTELYVEVEKFAKTEVLPGITILKYSGCLNFVNRIFFKNKILDLINSTPKIEENANKILPSQEAVAQEIIIVDFKSLTYLDPSGAECLKSIIFEIQRLKKTVFFAGLPGNAIEVLRICNVIEQTGVSNFPSVHDAVIYAQSRQAAVYSIRL